MPSLLYHPEVAETTTRRKAADIRRHSRWRPSPEGDVCPYERLFPLKWSETARAK